MFSFKNMHVCSEHLLRAGCQAGLWGYSHREGRRGSRLLALRAAQGWGSHRELTQTALVMSAHAPAGASVKPR